MKNRISAAKNRISAALFAAALFAAAFAAYAPGAPAAELKVLSGNGSRPAIVELSAQFEKATGHKVNVEFFVNPTVKKKVEDGEAFDVTVLNPPVLDDLIRQGKVLADTRAVIGRIGLGAAIRAGAPRPDISTVEGFKRALLASKSVAYPGDGASGIYFVSLVERLGIASEMKSRLKPMPGEYNVEVVADGGADMVVVVASRIYGVKGVDMIGLIPAELQTWIGFATGVSAKAAQPDAARALAKFYTAPEAAKVLTPMGIEPFRE